MVKEELRKLLNQPYKSDNWKKITEFVFPNVSYLQKAQEIPIPEKFQKIADSFKQLGSVRLNDGKNLAMFEVHVSEKVNISSNRVQLRKLVAELIDQQRNHGVLVVYEQGKEDYRFTFTAKATEFDEAEGDFVNIETDAKRYTYILGKNESCKTAANRFWELSSNKDKATIKDVEQAFSVERLNKEFFDKYKSFYEDFVQHITGKRFEKEKSKWVEKTKGKPIPEHETVFRSDDKLARNFVKLLLGRLVFIQFLQKKGWMGVPAGNSDWKGGDKDFLINLFNSCENKETFHSAYLYRLFFNAFNTPDRPNDVFELTGTRIPYLNGGLFENEIEDSDLIDFPESYFHNLLDFFSQYNFTIDENDPQDHEVGIDPEMLGHIFENLLEDNKDKGAFYTPKPIVQYMCQESLINYLFTYLTNDSILNDGDADALMSGLQNFVRKKTASQIIDFDEQIATALRDVKICDPAIGSGAFPMGLLNEIYYCVQVIYNASPDVVGEVWKMKNWQADVVKKNIIQQSIYGVDLEKGAVDIARLRFWLSLIVDEKAPYPLPNLDYKIVCGNSLMSLPDGVMLDLNLESEIEELKKEYFNLNDLDLKIEKRTQINQKTNLLLNSVRELYSSLDNLNFDIKLSFSEVFHDKKGFDIIIGNPPYIQEYENKAAFDGLRASKFYKGKMDIWHFFASYCIDLLYPNKGILCFIAKNNWTTNYGASIMRNKVIESSRILQMIDFNNYMVFESASVQTMIMMFQNDSVTDDYRFDYRKLNENGISKRDAYDLLVKKETDKNLIFEPKLNRAKYNNRYLLFATKEKEEVLIKILNKGNLELIPEGNAKKKIVSELGQGIVPPQDFLNGEGERKLKNDALKAGAGIFVISKEEKKKIPFNEKELELIKPYYTSAELNRYYGDKKNTYYIIYTDSRFKGANLKGKKAKIKMTDYPNIQNHLDLFKKIITSDNKPYGLHRAREQRLFEGEKIMIQRKSPGSPICTYTDFPCYVSQSYNIVKTDRINNLYLVGLLNSKLMGFWLRYKGKMQGNNYQLDNEPLAQIPILKIDNVDPFVARVKLIIDLKDSDETRSRNTQEELDIMFYKVYGLEYKDVLIIDPNFGLKEDKYNKFTVS